MDTLDSRIFSNEAMQGAVLYRDARILVVNKPVHIPVHRTPKGGESLEDYFPALMFEAASPPALAHRLDKETSGCLVLGRQKEALAHLGKLFQQGKIKKRYLAIVRGRPPEAAGRVSFPIKRFDLGRGKWEFRCDAGGQEAHTDYETLRVSDTHALVLLSPLTGRTHQLRLHCQAMGCPIVGDTFYGNGEGNALMLHAAYVALPLQHKAPPIEVRAPLPEHFVQALRSYGLGDGEPAY